MHNRIAYINMASHPRCIQLKRNPQIQFALHLGACTILNTKGHNSKRTSLNLFKTLPCLLTTLIKQANEIKN